MYLFDFIFILLFEELEKTEETEEEEEENEISQSTIDKFIREFLQIVNSGPNVNSSNNSNNVNTSSF